MPFDMNPDVAAVVEPPIAEAKGWVTGQSYPADRPLLDLCQAVPSYPPAEALRDHLAERVRLFETAQYTQIRYTRASVRLGGAYERLRRRRGGPKCAGHGRLQPGVLFGDHDAGAGGR